MPSFTNEIEFEVFCATCGKGLCNTVSTEDATPKRSARMRILPCEDCMDRRYQEGVDQGREEERGLDLMRE